MEIAFSGGYELESLDLANTLVDSLIEKKGHDILLLDIRDQAVFTDFFIICSGDSGRQLRALMDSVTETAKLGLDVLLWGVEGDPEDGWVLVDFGGVVIHIFSPERRRYYNLEQLWSQGHVLLRVQ